MDEVIFSIGILNFYWFGTVIAIAFIMGFIVACFQAFLQRESLMDVLKIMCYSFPVSLFFARINYVLIHWQLYKDNYSDIFRFWQGGLSFFGAITGLVLVVFLYAHIQGRNFLRWTDLTVPGLALGQAIGELANVFSQESFGYPTTDSWGIYIDYAYRPIGFEQYDYFRPLFLYESAWSLALFILLFAVSIMGIKYKKIPQGSISFLYLILYMLGNIVFSGMSLNSEGTGLSTLSQSVILALIIGISGWYFKGSTSKYYHTGRG